MADTFPVKSEQKPTPPVNRGFRLPFDSLRMEIDRLFDDFVPSNWRSLSRLGRPGDGDNWAISPAVDVVENDDAFEITAEVPGLDEKNIEVKLSNGMLSIRGEKSEEKEQKEKSYHLSERHYGSFQRSFQLPEVVDADKVKASFANGVLKIALPKNANAKKSDRKIEITTS